MFKKEDRDKDAEALSLILGLKKDFVLEKLNLDSSNEILKNNLTDEEINEVKKLKLDGLYVTEETKRYYPQESLASHIVGYVGGEGRGQYGLEEFYEKIINKDIDYFMITQDYAQGLYAFKKRLENQPKLLNDINEKLWGQRGDRK